MKDELTAAIHTIRKTALDGTNTEQEHGWKVARLLSEAIQVFDQLPESASPVLIQAAESIAALPYRPSGNRAEILQSTHALLEPLSRAIHRLAARQDEVRYLTVPDLVAANELLTKLPPAYETSHVQWCVESARAVVPGTSVVGRVTAFIETMLHVRPFAEGNSMTALMGALGFLQANGYETTLTEEGVVDVLRHLLRGHGVSEELFQVQQTARDERVYRDIIEELARRYGSAVAKAEFEHRTGSLQPFGAVPARVETNTAIQPRPGPSFTLQYLTVQDIVWINTQMMGKPQSFRYDPLEEAAYYQYNYGQSADVLGQAARFLIGFTLYKPFEHGNLVTALVSVLTFLEINGYEAHLLPSEAERWLQAVVRRKVHPLDAIRPVARPVAHHVERNVRNVALELAHQYRGLKFEV